jgi:pimeloyl-ACP methyl ester carboxylesterase
MRAWSLLQRPILGMFMGMIPVLALVGALGAGSACAGPPPEGTTSFHTAAAPAPAAGTMFIYPERVALREGGFATVERGTLFVPLNRSAAGSDVIGIEVYRFSASDRAEPGTPPIFFLPGGPSFGGLERELEGTFEDRWLPLTDVSDVVVVGQRGIGSSKPTTTIETTSRPASAEQPYDAEAATDEYRRTLAGEKAFWEETGLDLSGFTILEAVEDVNDVRTALGYDKIIIWGGSFGSHWGMNVMRPHPEIVERAILRGMEGPDHTYDHPGHLWNVYERVAEEAEAAPELQGMIPEGGLIAAIEAIVERATNEPFTVTVIDPEDSSQHEVLFDGESVKRVSRGYWGRAWEAWPADVITMARGDFTGAANKLYRQSMDRERNFNTASFFVLDCGSGITPERLADYDVDPAMSLLARMNWTYVAGCSVWDIDLGDDFRQNFETPIPTVIAHGTWDTSTPYENALELVPYFEDSKFIPVIRGPHGAIRAAMDSSEEFRLGILHFAATGDTSRLPDEVTMPPVRWLVPRPPR